MIHNLTHQAIHYDGNLHSQAWVADGKSTILFVYAEWCGYCKKTMPEFIKASSMQKVRFAVMSDDEVAKMENPLQVNGYPSFFLIDGNGVMSSIRFPREHSEMVKFVNQM